jgi:hypothetical protein
MPLSNNVILQFYSPSLIKINVSKRQSHSTFKSCEESFKGIICINEHLSALSCYKYLKQFNEESNFSRVVMNYDFDAHLLGWDKFSFQNHGFIIIKNTV